jgi:hypothetical protein
MKRLGPILVAILSLLAACAPTVVRPEAGRQPAAEHATNSLLAGPARPNGNKPNVNRSDVNTPDGIVPDADRIGRVGPDGAPPDSGRDVADRGIGGTGAPVGSPMGNQVGGPVAIATAIQSSDRGIGGTGIIGIVTGFGSVFADGIEIEYDDQTVVDIDGKSAPLAALRAGQLVVIRAEGPPTALHAKTISVRSEAIGQIEALDVGSGTLTIAGQAVAVPPGAWGASRFGLGDWVQVSGLRRGDGTIMASRLDPAPADVLLARGQVILDGAEARVGNLLLTGTAAANLKDGQFVVVSGNYVAGRGNVTTVAPDTLLPDPEAYFGKSANQLFLLAFVRVDKCSIWMNGIQIRSEFAVSGPTPQGGVAVVSLQRKPDGSYTAVGLSYSDYRGYMERPVRGGTNDGGPDDGGGAHDGGLHDGGSHDGGPGTGASAPQRHQQISASRTAVPFEGGPPTNRPIATAAIPPSNPDFSK